MKLTGEKLAKAAVNQILAHPETWKQTRWHSDCGTKHCFAGWCQILSGKEPSGITAKKDAKEALGITERAADFLFGYSTKLETLYWFAKDYSLYNAEGYNVEGYGRDGYNVDGYDREGYNSEGYNSEGYNRAGYDREGYNSTGYDREGRSYSDRHIELTPFEL